MRKRLLVPLLAGALALLAVPAAYAFDPPGNYEPEDEVIDVTLDRTSGWAGVEVKVTADLSECSLASPVDAVFYDAEQAAKPAGDREPRTVSFDPASYADDEILDGSFTVTAKDAGGDGFVFVSCRRTADSGGYGMATFTVADHGPGEEPEEPAAPAEPVPGSPAFTG
jgi:hypothetical protein